MREGKHLGRLCISPVDEDKRGIGITQGEATELVHIQSAMGVVANDAIHHRHDAERLDGLAQFAHGCRPGWRPLRPDITQPERSPHFPARGCRVVRQLGGSDKAYRFCFGFNPFFPQPGLPPLHEIDGVHQFRADALGPSILGRAEIRKRQRHLRRFLQEEESERHTHRFGEVLQLSHGGLGCFSLPVRQLREFALQISQTEPGALPRSAKDSWIDCDSVHPGMLHIKMVIDKIGFEMNAGAWFGT